ncbi:GNAT family N-acetyltransferase [Enterococcus sp. BWM-S5]|uniref:GNAT family N-acetyltransferase n=2 Tax=Enterococcus larvae TaxID=2794352 RepID=A0ABS4CGT6_9ENTE|nr:GNAT family N-acetyltransferase [Enterococcus larvae]MBP1045428.1 GNAT family N-acetyltransferase [Enterococcus larvae]
MNQLERKIKDLEYYKNQYHEKKKGNQRCSEYEYFLANKNVMIIDKLDNYPSKAIYIYELNRPSEQWMFDLGFNLQFEDFATLIGKLELGVMINENALRIRKLGVSNNYRNQGDATYMMTKAIHWGKVELFSSISLFASTSAISFYNELNQEQLIKFYNKLGFSGDSRGYMTYKYTQ